MRLETLFEKFELFADAPDAVGKMRELVFQLAVQGRLVQQDRTEESATVLLKRIRAARAELPTNRRSIDETDTTELEEGSTPFAAPSGWTWTSLGNVQVFTNGYAFKSEDYQSSGVGIIRMGELGANGDIDERNMKYVANDIAHSLPETFHVRPGDLLMGMSGSIGKLAINRSDKTYLLNQRVGRLEPILIEKAFLHVFLKTIEQHYLRISFGMAIKNLSTKQINETPFPLPPLAEQKRIVAKVDELMALCDRLEAQQKEQEDKHTALVRASLARFSAAPTPANLNFLFHSSFSIQPSDLRKSILTLAVQGKLVPQDPNDEPAETTLGRYKVDRKRWAVAPGEERQAVPDSWTWIRFAGVGEQRLGKMLDAQKNRGELKPYLRNTNVQWMRFELDDVKDMRVEEREVEELRLKAGDLLICEGGEPGRCAIWRDTVGEMYFQKAIHRVRPCDGVTSEYLALNLQLDCANGVLAGYFTGATIKHLTGRSLAAYPVPLPPPRRTTPDRGEGGRADGLGGRVGSATCRLPRRRGKTPRGPRRGTDKRSMIVPDS